MYYMSGVFFFIRKWGIPIKTSNSLLKEFSSATCDLAYHLQDSTPAQGRLVKNMNTPS